MKGPRPLDATTEAIVGMDRDPFFTILKYIDYIFVDRAIAISHRSN